MYRSDHSGQAVALKVLKFLKNVTNLFVFFMTRFKWHLLYPNDEAPILKREQWLQ